MDAGGAGGKGKPMSAGAWAVTGDGSDASALALRPLCGCLKLGLANGSAATPGIPGGIAGNPSSAAFARYGLASFIFECLGSAAL